jgi:acylpyruvate hydrolase
VRLAVFGEHGRVGVVREDSVVDISAAYSSYLADTTGQAASAELVAARVPAELGAFIAAGQPALTAAREALRHLETRTSEAATSGAVLSHPLDDMELRPPLAARARLFMAGANYAAHAAGAEGDTEAGADAVERIRRETRAVGLRGFVTFRENCVGPRGDIVHPARTDMLDFEGEVAVVVGRECKDVKAAEAADAFWGYLLVNDVSARRAIPAPDNPRSRFARDKNFDSSNCVGPYVVVGELDDPQDIRWETRVNGEIRQQGHTRDMIFSFAEMLEYLSQDMTLYPGDVIAGGTTSGTIMDTTPVDPERGRDPAAFLRAGDVVEVSNPVLGSMRNAVVAKAPRP